MAETNEPRALTAALAGPAFTTRGAGLALHAANRHVERWAPEEGASRVRPLRSLGFVDRLIAPWIETAQRSASLRMFGQYNRSGFAERTTEQVSWVFPRPWYQDELDWMAAARQTPQQSPSLFTTRGTYVAPARPAQAPPPVLTSALYEFVAPSLSVSAPTATRGPSSEAMRSDAMRGDAYSSLVPLAAIQAAELMNRAVTPALAAGGATARMTPALRAVLSTMLERATLTGAGAPAARIATHAPELVTPPAPRAESVEPAAAARDEISPTLQLADRYAVERARIVEVQRIAQKAAERELGLRAEVAASREAAVAATAAREAAARPDVTAAATPEVRAAAQRAEAELRNQAAATRAAQLTGEQRRRIEVEQTAAVSQERARLEEHARIEERARLEGRVAQRVAERVATQRLHERSRTEAAEHARTPIAPTAGVETAPGASAVAVEQGRAPAEVAAALAALPPELASFLGQRPENALQAIVELGESLRAVELMARGAAAGASFELTRGPRLMMPAGLGGLVAAVDRASSLAASPDAQLFRSIADQPGMTVERMSTMGLAGPMGMTSAMGGARGALTSARASSSPAMIAPSVGTAMRAPALPWIAPPAGAPSSSSALGATLASPPAALTHVAWADRWLARFAGASQHSLDTLAAGAGTSSSRMQALAAAAPHGVFVAPIFDIERDPGAVQLGSSSGHTIALSSRSQLVPSMSVPAASTPSAPSTSMPLPVAPARVVRYDDNAETPDDVFAAISAAAAQTRVSGAPVTPAAAAAAAAAALAATTPPFERPSIADTVAHMAPSAPNAGFAAQLASSPFAAALRHVLPLPSAASFDVRALFAGGMSATYLAGLLAPESRAIELATTAMPGWASWTDAGAAAGAAEGAPLAERSVPGWDATYVTPEQLAGELGRPFATDADRPFATVEDRAVASDAGRAVASDADRPLSLSEDQRLEWSAAQRAISAPLTTLRSALLSWNVETDGAGATTFAPPSIAGTQIGQLGASLLGEVGRLGSAAPITGPVARGMIDAMSLPMLGEGTQHGEAGAWAAPGMVGSRAHSWSVAQERSASDLALDFVTPELVLAARVYGLGPAEAAQALRLALAGPGQLTAMASTVDRTFVQAMAIEADRRARDGRETAREGRSARITTAYPTPAGDIVATGTSVAAELGAVSTSSAMTATVVAPSPTTLGTAFGVERRPPRGAYLWPAATVGALGMSALAADGEQSMSVAALELLAAHAVAEIGTFAALGAFDPLASAGLAGLSGSVDARGGFGAGGAIIDGDVAAVARTDAGAMPGRAGATPSTAIARDMFAAEPSEADVLGAAAALVPSARRARFDALYVALSQTATGTTWSPAARAARALALAGRGDDAAPSPRERATLAWDVLPVVYATETLTDQLVSSSGVAARELGSTAGAARSGGRMRSAPEYLIGGHTLQADVRPGLGALSARAGEALGSYVTASESSGSSDSDSGSSSSSSSSSREIGAVHRAPSAAQEMVQTGRPAGRHGGGEVEIPPWFEAAARRMFEQDRSSPSSDISLADLTLVTAAPSTHVAASTRTAPSAAPISPAAGSVAPAAGNANIDVEKLANEIYRHILTLMDAARARNGEPYL